MRKQKVLCYILEITSNPSPTTNFFSERAIICLIDIDNHSLHHISQITLGLWEVHMQSRMVQDINKVAEGLVTTVEVSEGVVDSLCVQEWDEGLSMDRHQERSMGVEAPGWVRRVADDVVRFYFFFTFCLP